MKKLKLEALAVESFEIERTPAERGTVAGHATLRVTCFGQQTCGAQHTCLPSCACDPETYSGLNPSCVYTCWGWC